MRGGPSAVARTNPSGPCAGNVAHARPSRKGVGPSASGPASAGGLTGRHLGVTGRGGPGGGGRAAGRRLDGPVEDGSPYSRVTWRTRAQGRRETEPRGRMPFHAWNLTPGSYG